MYNLWTCGCGFGLGADAECGYHHFQIVGASYIVIQLKHKVNFCFLN